MANTYTLISSNTLSSSAASVTFSSIPATYTDLVLRFSTRSTFGNNYSGVDVTLNSDSSALYSITGILGQGSTASSSRASAATAISIYTDGNSTTANTFNNSELYLPSYTASQSKPLSISQVLENNSATVNMIDGIAGLYRSNTAISIITLTTPFGNFASTSSFYLYGIKNS